MFGIKLPFWSPRKGDSASPMLSDERAVLHQMAQGKLWHLAKQKKLFTASQAAAGAVIPIYSNTTQQFGLVNPLGSGKVACIHQIAMTYVSTTGAAGGYCLTSVKDIGGGVATGGNLASATKLTTYDALSNGIASALAKCYAVTPAVVVAPALHRQLGINQLVTTATDATNVTFDTRIDFDGDVGIVPGTAIFLSGNLATLTIWSCGILWSEEDD